MGENSLEKKVKKQLEFLHYNLYLRCRSIKSQICSQNVCMKYEIFITKVLILFEIMDYALKNESGFYQKVLLWCLSKA